MTVSTVSTARTSQKMVVLAGSGSGAFKGNVNLKNLEGEEWNTPEFILNNLAEEATGGPPSHRQPPEIVWANQGDYLRQICKKL